MRANRHSKGEKDHTESPTYYETAKTYYTKTQKIAKLMHMHIR